VRADLDKTASQEKEGQTTEILQGSIKFGKNTFSPDFEYKVDNIIGRPECTGINSARRQG
jgi:hypothetical protein